MFLFTARSYEQGDVFFDRVERGNFERFFSFSNCPLKIEHMPKSSCVLITIRDTG